MYDQSLSQMAGVKALHVVCNPFSQRTILIVSAKQWQVFKLFGENLRAEAGLQITANHLQKFVFVEVYFQAC